MILALLLAAAAHAAPVMVVDSAYVAEGEGEGEGEGEEYWLPLDANGWTVLPEATVDTKLIYVSSSTGNDTTGDGTISAPYATIAKAYEESRNGTYWWEQPGWVSGLLGDEVQWFEDWILLKCGDTWDESLNGIRPGPSPEHPMVVASYGTGARPVVTGLGKSANHNYAFGNWAVIGIEFTGGIGYTNEQWEGTWREKPDYVLVEDCLARGIHFSATDHVTIRRSVIVDTYSTVAHAQGSYMYDTDNMLIEECIYDHNGWHDTIEGAGPTVFNHNLYITENCEGFIFRNSITARASATGAQLRAGGDCTNNLFLDNPLALDWGYLNGSPLTPGGVTGEVTDNVVLGAANICRPRPSCTGNPRGIGFQIGNVASGTISGNIISTVAVSATNNNAILLASMGSGIENPEDGVGLNNLTISDNHVYDWDGDADAISLTTTVCSGVVFSGNRLYNTGSTYLLFHLPASWTGISFSNNTYYGGPSSAWEIDSTTYNFANWVSQVGETGASNSAPSWADPTRSIATYMASLGYAEGDQTVEKFIELARANSKADWDTYFTADAVNDYIRAGFEE